jgi:Transposase protein
MGYGTTRSLERIAAAMGELDAAPVRFEAAADITEGGVLLALPALLAIGLLRYTPNFYKLPKGYYGIDSIFLLLAMMALARLTSIEQLRYVAPGEWGDLLGLDRVPEVRCLRSKLALLSGQDGQAAKWNTELAKDWMGELPGGEMLFYMDGHVRVYHGSQTELPRHYVARQRLCLRATTDYWINAMDGQPFFYVNREADPGLLATMRQDLVPWLETNAPVTAEHRARMATDPRQPLFTLIFDREGYSPDFFREMETQRIAILSYHKFAGPDWPVEEFQAGQVKLAGGETVEMLIAERATVLSNGLKVREIRKGSESGHQVSILATNQVLEKERVAAAMFARWSQENFYKYMREHYGLDRLVEYAVGPVPATVSVVNPARRKLDSNIRTLTAQINRCGSQFAALSLEGAMEVAPVARYQTQKSALQERIGALQKELDQLKIERKTTPKHVEMKDLPESERFQRLLPERKHFVDTIKLIAYRAETSLASVPREKLARSDDARALLRQIFHTEVDLAPDLQAKTLTVRLHHLAQNAHDVAVLHLCHHLNATETLFPGTDLRVVYRLGSK